MKIVKQYHGVDIFSQLIREIRNVYPVEDIKYAINSDWIITYNYANSQLPYLSIYPILFKKLLGLESVITLGKYN